MGPRFQDRFDAGRFLAARLKHHAGDPSRVVLGLPKAGVAAAYEIARELDAPLDAFVVRKLGAPGYEELAFGAIASRGVQVLNYDVIHRLGIPPEVIETIAEAEGRELVRIERACRGNRDRVPVTGRKVALVDDGLGTGATMRAAIATLRRLDPAQIIMAVPVGSQETCDRLRREVDELICGETPEPFFSVGTWYSNFLQVTDGEVRQLLDRAAQERRARHMGRSQRAFPE